MPTFSELLPATASHKHNGVRWTPDLQRPGCGALAIHTGRTVCAYAVTEFPTPWEGRAFHLAKPAGEPGTDPESDGYDVFCGRGGRAECDCKGFERWGNCKHAEGVRALLENGWLDLHLVNPDRDVGSTEERPF